MVQKAVSAHPVWRERGADGAHQPGKVAHLEEGKLILNLHCLMAILVREKGFRSNPRGKIPCGTSSGNEKSKE